VNKEFYKAVLPPNGPYCAVGINGDTVRQTFHNTIDELIERGEELTNDGLNAYFALAAFKDESSRKAHNARELRSLFLDLDCGPTKPYATQEAALAALTEFCTEQEFPEPVILSSGRGLHVYWPLTEVLDLARWKIVASGFKRFCISVGFAMDEGVPADAARVLRMPGTLNFKSEPPSPVGLWNELRTFELSELEHKFPAPPADIFEAKQFGVDEFTASLGAQDYPPTSFVRLVRRSLKGSGCAQIAQSITEAEALSEPLWRAALSIAWRCTDGEESIHTLSRAHPEYNPEDTLKKAQATKGPMTCEWYRANNPTTCSGCKQQVASPIMLGRKIEEAESVDGEYVVEAPLDADDGVAPVQTVTVTIPTYPAPYFRPAGGGVYKRAKDEDGNPTEIEVYPYDIYLTTRFYDYDEFGVGEGEMVGMNVHSPHDGIRRLVVPTAKLLVKEKLRDLLLQQGVAALNKKVDDIMAYFASTFRKLQQQGAATRTRNQMGWTPECNAFVIGESEYTARSLLLAPASTGLRELAPLLSSKGSLEAWSQVANFYARPGMEAHAFALFAGFGAPLLKLVGGMEVRGAVINLMSNKSGTGKTTAQMVVNSIFGHPSGLLMRKNDTQLAKMQWVGMLNSIPATMDEVTNMTDEAISELIYDIPQGRGRHRMESQSNKLRANNISWSTFLITSSNSSLYDKLTRLKGTPDGELRRLIEIRISRPDNISKSESDAVFGSLNDHYGVAGPVYIKYILNNMAEVVTLVRSFQTKFDEALDLDQSDRFYSIVCACIFAGASIASTLRLHSIPIAPVFDYAVGQLSNIRTEVVLPAADFDNVASEALAFFLSDNLSNALVINKNSPNGIPAMPIHTPRGPLMFRLEPDVDELWVPASTLKNFLTDRQIDTRQAIKEFVERGYLKNAASTSKRITAGAITGLAGGVLRSYCFKASALGIKADVFAADSKAGDQASAGATEAT
jgi:hypothetical protein